jgi:hypothetical protein
MKTRPLLLRALLALGPVFSMQAQQASPVPAPPPQINRDKAAEAAAAIQPPLPVPAVPAAPKMLPAAPSLPPAAPPPLPPVARPVPSLPQPSAPPVSVAPAPAAPDNSASKMQALEAATSAPGGAQEVPRVATPAEKMPVTTSTSASGQFRVHGKELSTRSAMSSHLDDIAAELRAVLGDSQPFSQPVVVLLNTGEDARKLPPGTPPVSIVITEVEAASGGGFHLQMTVNEGPDLKLGDLRRETVRVLLAERIVRGHAQLTKPENRLLLPDWLFNGVLQAMDYRAAARPSTMFAAIFKSGKIYGIEEIIEASPTQMDSLSRAIYDTSCAALVMALADQPNGGTRLNKFLNSLAADPRPERELLSAAFPEFNASASSLNKWWALQMATLAKRGMAEPLGPDESLRALEDAITIRYHAPEKEAPKDIQPRPFVIPAPLNVIPPDAPKPKPPSPVAATDEPPVKAVASASPKKAAAKKSSADAAPEPAPSTDEAAAEETAGDGKSSRWLRYLTFGLAGGKKAEEMPETAEDPAEEEPATKKTEKTAAADMPPETEKTDEEPASDSTAGGSSLFSRLMSRDRLRVAEERQKAADEMARLAEEKAERVEKAAEEKKAAEEAAKDKKTGDKPKPASTDKPQAPAPPPAKAKSDDKPVEEPETKEDKPSKLNPLNWFRGGKKTEEKKPEEKKTGDEPLVDETKGTSDDKKKKPAETEGEAEAAVLLDLGAPARETSVLEWLSPSLADAWQFLTPAQPRPAFLDFLKRKKDEKKEEEKPAEPPPPAKPAAAPKKKDSKSSPPRSTNPNAKPVARPVKPADGSPRTTNPAAKPLPVPQQPPATAASTATDDDLGKPPPGMVLVTLPVEEYQHVLKRKDRKEILERNVAALRALQLRTCVLFRPVVTAYLDVMLALQQGKTKDMETRLPSLRQAALAALQNTKAVRDYLDWYEANETGRLSGKFDDFLNLPALIQRELPPREDPISKYLDAIDKQFSK